MFSITNAFLLSAVALSYVSAAPTPATITVLAPIPEGTVTANILGVDSAGHTTYAIEQPVIEGLSNGLSSTVTTFTATLVAGSNYASETVSASYSAPGFQFVLVDGAECTITGDSAVCNDGTTTITTDAAFVSASLMQVMDVVSATATPAPTGAAASGKTSGAVGRSVLGMGAVTVGAAFALLGSVL
ncbi:hypothetical protein HMN09_00313400 [Mycena chlorophos]|uniref:Uncharacterized protein n=2 Tax=Mycena chlorophos TaxID=658473 RepID=A0A146INA3_MYCCL|nr:hypothetical protein HMN09_00313400 [Mycena chlorophos]GAT61083.1 predicted protein [Mycena chlorophos]